MPRKGMRSICFHPRTPSLSVARRSSASPSNHRLASCGTTVDEIIDSAAVMVMKWDPDGSTFARVTSIFHENRQEAAQFIRCVGDLQKAMQFLVSEDSTSPKLVQAHDLMQVAMKRLQKEFYNILSINRAHLDPESVSSRASARSSTSTSFDYESEDDGSVRAAGDLISEVERESSTAMEDLKSIAECMISSGYAKECVRVYKIIRKSIVDEGIYRLGFEKITPSQSGKMDLEVIEIKIKSWLEALKIAMATLFTGERILCDHVFASSGSIRESCFAEICREGATILFRFPEIVSRNKKSPNKLIFRLLNMYSAISQHWPEIESIFSYDSTSAIRSQATTSLLQIGDSVRGMLADFESSIRKDSSKSPVPGGGVHGLTRSVMDYLTLLADYNDAITDIFSGSPLPEKSSLPESYFESSDSDDGPLPAVSAHVAWLILILLCKLDGKAEHYKDVSVSYLFLANNLQHVLKRVRASNLQCILGEDWIAKHEAKVRRFAANYERLGWGQVVSSLPENPTAAMSAEEVKEWFRRFSSSFEQAFRRHSACVVPDPKLRDEINVSISRKLVPVYREFHDTHHQVVKEINSGSCVRYSPEDVANYLSDLFFEMGESESGSTGSSLGELSQSRWGILRDHLIPRLRN